LCYQQQGSAAIPAYENPAFQKSAIVFDSDHFRKRSDLGGNDGSAKKVPGAAPVFQVLSRLTGMCVIRGVTYSGLLAGSAVKVGKCSLLPDAASASR
jgi:hypothetical protein